MLRIDLAELGIVAAIAVIVLISLLYGIGRFFQNAFNDEYANALDKRLEALKAQLRNSEYLFQKQVDAANDFASLVDNGRDMDWSPELSYDDDFIPYLASKLDSVEGDLKVFRNRHNGVIFEGIRSNLNEGIWLCSKGAYFYNCGEIEKAEKAAAELDKLFGKTREVFDELITSQTSAQHGVS